jgi:hypothetical protein
MTVGFRYYLGNRFVKLIATCKKGSQLLEVNGVITLPTQFPDLTGVAPLSEVLVTYENKITGREIRKWVDPLEMRSVKKDVVLCK